MVVIQAAQVLLMAGGVLVFFLLFGALTMGVDVQSAWTGLERDEITKLPYLVQVSVPLGKVSLFLAAFSLLYLAVSTVTDDTYREQFFGRRAPASSARAVPGPVARGLPRMPAGSGGRRAWSSTGGLRGPRPLRARLRPAAPGAVATLQQSGS